MIEQTITIEITATVFINGKADPNVKVTVGSISIENIVVPNVVAS